MSDVCSASSVSGTSSLSRAYGVRVADEVAQEEGGRKFAALLRQHRTALGLRQEDVAELSGVHLSTYSRWERGIVRNPVGEEVQAVCRVLRLSTIHAGVALGYLSAEDAERVPEPPRTFSPEAAEALAILEDPDMPNETKYAALQYLRFLRANSEKPGNGNGQSRAS
jgi:transcriptional regulator with XRE-family HTH domain